jgi:hypothetical protein
VVRKTLTKLHSCHRDGWMHEVQLKFLLHTEVALQ